MFIFGWGMELLGWVFGWMFLGIIRTILSIKKLLVVSLWILSFRLNLEYKWIDDNSLKGVIYLFSFPALLIYFGREYKRIEKED
jgi:hypothetical protein